MNKFFVKQTYVFDESLFRIGYPYKLQYEDIGEPLYELFIKIDPVSGNAVFRRYDGFQHSVLVQDYLDGKLTITGPLTITFDDCAISIDDVKPESFITELKMDAEDEEKAKRLMKLKKAIEDSKQAIGVARKTQQILDEINGYPHAFITVNTDSTSPYTISDGHTPLTTELEDIMRNDDTDKEETNK